MARYLANKKESRTITLTSFLFTFPAIYGLYNRIYILSTILIITSLISANYWRKPTYSWRRDLDLIFAKFSFILFVTTGFIYVPINYSYSGVPLIICCYMCSEQLHKNNTSSWYYFHAGFHFLMMCELFNILYFVNRSIRDTANAQHGGFADSAM